MLGHSRVDWLANGLQPAQTQRYLQTWTRDDPGILYMTSSIFLHIIKSISKFQTTYDSIGLIWSNLTREVSIFLGTKWCLQMFLPRHDFVKNSKAKSVCWRNACAWLYKWMEEKVTSKLNLDWKSRGCPRNLHENSGLGLRFQLLILATQSRVVWCDHVVARLALQLASWWWLEACWLFPTRLVQSSGWNSTFILWFVPFSSSRTWLWGSEVFSHRFLFLM